MIKWYHIDNMLRFAIIMVIMQVLSFVLVIFEVLYQLYTVTDWTKNSPDQYYISECFVKCGGSSSSASVWLKQ